MKTQEELRNDYLKQQEFFIERIGKRIYRDSYGCICETCMRITNEGLIIQDKQHAMYLNDCSGEEQIKYRDEK